MPRQGQDKLCLGAGDKTQGGSASSPHSPHLSAPSHSWWPTQPRDPSAKLENQVLPSSSLSQLQHQITSLAATLQPPHFSPNPRKAAGYSPLVSSPSGRLAQLLTFVSLAASLVSPPRGSTCPAATTTATAGAGQGSSSDTNCSALSPADTPLTATTSQV